MLIKVQYKNIKYYSKHKSYLKKKVYLIPPEQYVVFTGGISSHPIHFKLSFLLYLN